MYSAPMRNFSKIIVLFVLNLVATSWFVAFAFEVLEEVAPLKWIGLGSFAIIALIGYFLLVTFPNKEKQFLLPIFLVMELLVGLVMIYPVTWWLLEFEFPSSQHKVCCETPLSYGAAEYEYVRITMSDGEIISGWYVAPGVKAGQVIILIHGAFNDRRGTAWHASQLIKAGYGVLLYEINDCCRRVR
ncbi:MAG: hypothetical protein V4660_16265 [Pseudomonadota bacterium]